MGAERLTERKSILILGVRVDNLTQAEALARIETFLQSRRPHQVVTINPEFVVAAQRDGEFAGVLQEADLNLPDGQGVVWAARLLGTPVRERVTGVDTLLGMAELAAHRGYKLFLLGGAPGVAEEASQRLQGTYAGLRVVGTYAGTPAPEEENEIVKRIRQAQPDILWVAYWAPQQDLWIHRHLHRLEVPVAMGVGGALDFIAGRARRAPQWMQRLGLEWLHRLVHQPWRWRRMLALPYFVWLVLTRRATHG
ncbi:MAG: WecB/TagA/CpsF family glycosyltransferase [Chloroflexi bacterium]|nr:WecB/TagA/CpsF family glycosyltransferase [Chloroflexota bacterium]